MKHCDVLVVGGGPAGSACAWRLGRAGLDVIVLDKARFPRDKVCAGWITPAVIETLQLDAVAYRSDRVLQPITGFRVGQIGGEVVEARYEEPVSYGILRREFDDYLLARSGARLELGQSLTALERDGDAWIANGRVRASVVVGAGGHFCPVSRQLGNVVGRGESVVAAQEVEFALEGPGDCAVAPETPELYFCDDLKGYAWCFRKGRYLNVGLGREDSHGLAEHVEHFIAFLRREGRLSAALPARPKGHAYLLYGHAPRTIVGEGVVLVGDAAGLAYPQSGEGIRPAIESGIMAAEVIAMSSDYSGASLALYEERLTERFGRRQAPEPGPLLPESLRKRLARYLLTNRWFARHVVMDRWFLHRGQPVLREA